MRKDEKRGEENHYLNIGLLELKNILCQIHIENKDSEVWFGWNSQWLARLADLCRQPFGLVFSLRSMQTSWGVLKGFNQTFWGGFPLIKHLRVQSLYWNSLYLVPIDMTCNSCQILSLRTPDIPL